MDLEDSVLVIGFGRFSQIVCQSLLVRGINVSVIDRNIENIRAAAKFGFKVYYGDGIRLMYYMLRVSKKPIVSSLGLMILNVLKALFRI